MQYTPYYYLLLLFRQHTIPEFIEELLSTSWGRYTEGISGILTLLTKCVFGLNVVFCNGTDTTIEGCDDETVDCIIGVVTIDVTVVILVSAVEIVGKVVLTTELCVVTTAVISGAVVVLTGSVFA